MNRSANWMLVITTVLGTAFATAACERDRLTTDRSTAPPEALGVAPARPSLPASEPPASEPQGSDPAGAFGGIGGGPKSTEGSVGHGVDRNVAVAELAVSACRLHAGCGAIGEGKRFADFAACLVHERDVRQQIAPRCATYDPSKIEACGSEIGSAACDGSTPASGPCADESLCGISP